MIDPIRDYEQHQAFSEAYELVQTAELVGNDRRTYRIEVHRCYGNPNIPYTTRCWVQEDVTLQPTYPQSSDKGFHRQPESMRVWQSYFELPWTAGDTPEAVLAQAMSFLAERTKSGGTG